MTKPTTQEVLHAYTQTADTAKTIAARYRVSEKRIRLILKANINPVEYERLKIRKWSQAQVRANLSRYRARHGL